MPVDLYEPWRPLPGQRVRVRRSLECPSSHHIADLSDDGRSGVVGERRILVERAVLDGRQVGPLAVLFPAPPGHGHFVRYDEPIPTGVAAPRQITGQYYAAIELEPADAAE